MKKQSSQKKNKKVRLGPMLILGGSRMNPALDSIQQNMFMAWQKLLLPAV